MDIRQAQLVIDNLDQLEDRITSKVLENIDSMEQRIVQKLDRMGNRMEPSKDIHNNDLWNDVLNELKKTISKASFDTWFKSTKQHSFNEGKLTIVTGNEFSKDWLDGHYFQLIGSIIVDLTGKGIQLRFISSKDILQEEDNTPKKEPLAAPDNSNDRMKELERRIIILEDALSNLSD